MGLLFRLHTKETIVSSCVEGFPYIFENVKAGSELYVHIRFFVEDVLIVRY
jgi:hypothetical protein